MSVTELTDWEHSKENVIPLRKGRNAENLSRFFSDEAQPQQLEEQKREWEKVIAQYQGDDLLDLWCKYVEWTEQNWISGTEAAVVTERATQALTEQVQRYRHDPRLLRLYLSYAEKASNKLEVYAWLGNQRVGVDHAELYVRWAEALEEHGNYAQADKLYAQGSASSAAPLPYLRAAFRRFQHRMIRRAMHPCPPPQPLRHRSALAPLDPSKTRATPATQVAPQMKGTESKLRIYVEKDLSRPGSNVLECKSTEGKWAKLPTQQQSRKENTMLPSKWCDVKLPQHKRSNETTPTVPGFVIFKDEEFQTETPAPVPPKTDANVVCSSAEEGHKALRDL